MFKWPAVILFIGMSLGIFLQRIVDFPPKYWLILLAVVLSISAYFHIRSHRKQAIYFNISIMLMALCLSAILLYFEKNEILYQNRDIHPDAKTIVYFKPLKKLKTSTFYYKYLISPYWLKQGDEIQYLNNIMLLQIPKDDSTSINFNANYFALGKIKPISKPKAPFAFDYSAYMFENKVMFSLTSNTILLESIEQSFSLKNLYQSVQERIQNSSLSPLAKETLMALTIADRTEMNSDTLKVFSMAGIIHLFAISGLHIGLLFGMLMYFLMLFFNYKYRGLAIVISLVLISIYGLFIHFPTSVSRAIIMLSLYYGFQIFKRPSLSYHSLALAGIILLLINPYQLFNVGFQLSFAAVFFIFWLYPGFKKLLRKWKRGLREIVAVTLAAQIGTLPLSLLYFNQLSWIGLLLNVIIIPFAGVLVISSFLMLFCILFLPEMVWLNKLYNGLCFGIFWLAENGANLNEILVKPIAFSVWEVLAIYPAILYLKIVLKKFSNRSIMLGLSLVVLFLCVKLFENFRALNRQELIVYNEYKNTVLSLKSGNQLYYFSTTPLDENFKKYAIEPYRLGLRKPDIHYHTLTPGKLQYGNQNIWIINNSEIPENTDINDIILFQNSPKLDMKKIHKLQCQNFIADGSNYPNYISDLQKEMENQLPQKQFFITSEMGYYQKEIP